MPVRFIDAAAAALVALAVLPAAVQAAPLTAPAQRLVRWIGASADHGAAPFMVIDKQAARVWVFDAKGAALGSAPVLLGLAVGDESAPGIGEKALAHIKTEERTTPAGRFAVEPGRNLQGEDILWIDYEHAVSMHRLRALSAAERRPQRLASPTPADNRVSYGCVNVAADFYDRVLHPTFTRQRGTVYVLPEVRSLEAVFKLGGH